MNINNKIIKFWDEKGLSNIYSSTCNEDIIMSFSKNETEKHFLKYFIIKYKIDNKLALDIGSGLGRFTIFLSGFFDNIVSLEPSKNLYNQLKNNLKNCKNVLCVNKDFDSFVDSNKCRFNLILISGIFYLMEDYQVTNILERCKLMLNNSGIIIIRDFISKKASNGKSSFIEGVNCHYRDINWWNNCSKIIDMNILDLKKANIGHRIFTMLINYTLKKKNLKRIYFIMESILRNKIINRLFFELCKISPLVFINKNKVKTVFLVLK